MRLIYHLVRGHRIVLPSTRQRVKDNKEVVPRNFGIVGRLRSIREELTGMEETLDAFTYEDVEALRENLIEGRL